MNRVVSKVRNKDLEPPPIGSVTTSSGRCSVVPAVALFPPGSGPVNDALARSMRARVFVYHGDQVMQVTATNDGGPQKKRARTSKNGVKNVKKEKSKGRDEEDEMSSMESNSSNSSSSSSGSGSGSAGDAAAALDGDGAAYVRRWSGLNRRQDRDAQPRFAILAWNKATDHSIVVGCGPSFVLQPVLDAGVATAQVERTPDVQAPKSDRPAPVSDATEEPGDANALVAFGSKKQKRKTAAMQASRINADTVVAGSHARMDVPPAATSTTTGGSSSSSAAAAAGATAMTVSPDTLPEFDATTENVRLVYPPEKLINGPMQTALSPLVDELLEAAAAPGERVPPLVVSGKLCAAGARRLLALQAEQRKKASSESRNRRIVERVAFLSQLSVFLRLPAANLTVSKCTRDELLLEPVAELLLELFCTRMGVRGGKRTNAAGEQLYKRTKLGTDKLLNYMCVVSLLMNKLQTSPGGIALLQYDCRLSSDVIMQHFRSVGCKSVSVTPEEKERDREAVAATLRLLPEASVSEGQNKMVLRAPLKFPNFRHKRTKKGD